MLAMLYSVILALLRRVMDRGKSMTRFRNIWGVVIQSVKMLVIKASKSLSKIGSFLPLLYMM